MQFNKVAICGAGLIGGSIAAALSETRSADNISAFDYSQNLEFIQSTGWFKQVSDDLYTVISHADLVVVSFPVKEILRSLPEILDKSPEDSLIIDVGSTKRSIMGCASSYTRREAQFIGGHPMAGKEVSGCENAEPGLFKDKTFFLVPGEKTKPEFLEKAKAFVKILQGNPVMIAAEEHDRIVGLLSHFPQVLSTILINWTAQQSDSPVVMKLAGTGFKSLVRLAGSDFTVWQDIIEDNYPVIKAYIEDFAEYFNSFSKTFSAEKLRPEFETANSLYNSYIKVK